MKQIELMFAKSLVAMKGAIITSGVQLYNADVLMHHLSNTSFCFTFTLMHLEYFLLLTIHEISLVMLKI